MQTSTRTVVGVFDDPDAAQRAAERLVSSAFSKEDIDISSTPSHNGGTVTAVKTRRTSDEDGGGISGFFRRLVGADLDEEDRGAYAEAVRRGSTVVTVDTDEGRQDLAADILTEFGAIDIDRRAASWREQGYSGYEPDSPRYSEEEAARDREYYKNEAVTQSIPVVKEELRVGKRAVQRGGVRVYNQLREESVEESVNLREEHVHVDRRPVDRPATEADVRGQGEVIEVTEMAEEPVVEKHMRVVEEVVIGKEATQRTETIRDTVRRTDVSVENLPGKN